jgi:anthranilate phosphoribosyltransferase
VRVLQRMGANHAMVVWARDGMDEISLAGPTLVGELVDGAVREYEVVPDEFGLARADSALLRVAGPAQSKAMLLGALANAAGPARDIVALNAGAALYVAGVAESMAAGVIRAKAVLESGAARAKLDEFVAVTRELKEGEGRGERGEGKA